MITPACEPPGEPFSAEGCQCHLQQNARTYVPRREMFKEVAADIRTIFNALDRPTSEAYLARAVQKFEKSASNWK